jgi:hypothetical protein
MSPIVERDAIDSITAATAGRTIECRPKMIISLGRSGRGKSSWVRWLVDRSYSRGEQLVIADADRINPSLSRHYDDVTVLQSNVPHLLELMETWFAPM